MRVLSTLIFVFTLACPFAADAACGARGGPAFRGPDGKCVGWAALDRVCGSPPTTKCTYEGGGTGDTGQEKGKAYLGGMFPVLGTKSAAPSDFHVRNTKAEGIACASQTTMARIAGACGNRTDAADCKAHLDGTLSSGECAKLPAGTEVTIEAGSHSFDWLRFRVQGRPQPLWSQRSLVLD